MGAGGGGREAQRAPTPECEKRFALGRSECKVKAVRLIKEKRGFIGGIQREAQGNHEPPCKYQRVAACD